MALVPRYHVVADELPIYSGANVTMGSVVTLDSEGRVVQATPSDDALGLAGDTKDQSTPGIPSTNPAHLGVGGEEIKFTNRVSDPIDETRASAEMTVYHSGGKFATDQYDMTQSYTPMDDLYFDASGQITNVNTGSGIIGKVITEGEFMSGVPGTDINGDISLGDFLTFKLTV